jgi:hypothetical protein
MSTADRVNLVLLFTPGVLDVEDYKKIALRVREVDSGISVFIHEDRVPDGDLVDRLARYRTLVFSPMQVNAFLVKRGRVYAGRPMHKSEQLLRLQLAGVPVPEWAMLDRGKRFDPQQWGEYVVVKPEISSGARGVEIVRTSQLNDYGARAPQYVRGQNNFLAQRVIYNTRFSKIRIQTLFDEILFARRFRFPEPIRFDHDNAMRDYQQLFITENTRAEDFDSADVFALAKRCIDTFDGVAMLGLDVLLDEADQPFFIEANPGGYTWHISSALVGQKLRARGTFLERQFGALELAGDVLARRARKEAI